MKVTHEPARDIPVIAEGDVVVAGAGPAGAATAISAARLGARTILLEQGGAVGGVATSGLMSLWTGATRGPLYEEILERSADRRDGGFAYYGGKVREWRTIINTERLKTVLLEMLVEAGVDVRLYTLACRPVMEGAAVAGVITESKGGREAVLGRVVVDASGDGDIAALAGVPFTRGRESDGRMQPATLMFKVGGVDTERAVFPGEFGDTFAVPAGDLQDLGRQELPFPAGHVLLYPTTLPGVVSANMTNCLGVDGTRPEDLTRATLACRRQIEPMVEFLRRRVPGFESCFLLETAAAIGVRETRHFHGVKTITEQDILEARVFDDWIVTRAYFNFDIHNLSGPGLDATGEQAAFPQSRGYTIPYGCFVPEKVDGLLLAGRNISGTHLAHSNFRVMPICVNMGQGVGAAAALCAARGLRRPRDLDVGEVQDVLRRQGVEP
jgi:hypothetical protein